jgi:integrase
VDLERKLIRFIDTKNGEDRSIKIDSTLVEILKGLPSREKGRFRPDGEVFRGKGGEPIHRDGVTWPYRRALKKAGLERVRFHDLRHTAASWWVQAGVPLNTVRERLGHKSLAMTVRYAHLAPDHQDDCNAAVGAALSVGMGAHPQAPGGVGLRL